MHIHDATPTLAKAVSEIIVADMAAALVRDGANLSNDTAVAMALHAAGFGAVSIAALMDRARDAALFLGANR